MFKIIIFIYFQNFKNEYLMYYVKVKIVCSCNDMNYWFMKFSF